MVNLRELHESGVEYVRTRDGRKFKLVGSTSYASAPTDEYHWLCVTPKGEGLAYRDDGTSFSTVEGRGIIGPWVEPRTGSFWLNIYEGRDPNGIFHIDDLTAVPDNPVNWYAGLPHPSRNKADAAAGREVEVRKYKRLACIQVQWTEGDGLNEEQRTDA